MERADTRLPEGMKRLAGEYNGHESLEICALDDGHRKLLIPEQEINFRDLLERARKPPGASCFGPSSTST